MNDSHRNLQWHWEKYLLLSQPSISCLHVLIRQLEIKRANMYSNDKQIYNLSYITVKWRTTIHSLPRDKKKHYQGLLLAHELIAVIITWCEFSVLSLTTRAQHCKVSTDHRGSLAQSTLSPVSWHKVQNTTFIKQSNIDNKVKVQQIENTQMCNARELLFQAM